MADEGEIDVLGDFDLKLEAGSNMYDSNELPSKSANLLPEYTEPPWMLEQGWTLDNSCMDEKSKATIEKMLLEEQYYISGKSSRSKQQLAMSVDVDLSRKKYINKGDHFQRKIVWTDEEKDMFHRGMEIYGRSWTKIAELIPTRTSTQIKNFAHQLFRTLSKDLTPVKTETTTSSSPVSHDKDPLVIAMETVETATPTVKPNVPKRGRIPSKDKYSLTRKALSSKNNKIICTLSPASKKIPRIKKSKSKVFGKSKQADSVGSNNSGRYLSDVVLDNKLTITPSLIENLDGFCAVADIISGGNDEVINKNDDNDTCNDDDDDIHVDIENDDDSDSNPFLIGRSTSPNSVYEKLLTEANLNEIEEKGKDFGTAGDMSIITEDCNEGAVNQKNFLEWKTCESQNKVEGTVEIKCKMVKEEARAAEVDIKAGNVDTEVLKEKVTGDDEHTAKGESVTGDRKSNGAETDVLAKCDTVNLEQRNNLKAEEKTARQIDSHKVLVNALLREDGEVVHFPVPATEITLQPKVISDEETDVLREFFDNRPSKTPERYLRIRNYIIESWKKCQPSYLNKTSVRPGLKNCGDVNSIGRVHGYLECIGAINFRCDQAAYKHPRSIFSFLGREKINKDSSFEVSSAKMEAMRPRKRKVKDAFGVWIDEKDLEGMTYEHGNVVESLPKESKTRTSKTVYDPFKLIPCLSFSDSDPAPFSVVIHCSALIVMDIHGHISKTEVIGMLGGKFCVERGELTITMATPCNSISTGMQCEMDPVSQTQASEEIRGTGMDIVGWYHSHPSFAPNPSVRDIETQLKFQNWFSKGGSKFVGVIVSPYNCRSPGVCSEVNCLTASEEVLPQLQCNIPFKFNYSTRPCVAAEINHIILTAQDLATSYSNYPNRVDLSSTYSSAKGITCLEKMLQSLSMYCPEPDNAELVASVCKAFSPEQAGQQNMDISDTSSATTVNHVPGDS